MAAKKGAKKTARKGVKRGARKRSGRAGVVIDPNATLSPYARDALRIFSGGVQKAYANMARLGVVATVIVDGKLIRAVPTRSGGRFVVREPSPSRSRAR